MTAIRLTSIEHATDPETLEAVIGPIDSLRRHPLRTVGFTGAEHERLEISLRSGEHRSLVIKRVRPSADWTARRTRDPDGREASLLAEPSLGGVWQAFASPYLAFAAGSDHIALVMEDLSPHLFPDVREPLAEENEDLLLSALADLHSTFWESSAIELSWLAHSEQYAALLDAACAREPGQSAVLPPALRDGITRGWSLALKQLPASASRVMAAPAAEIRGLWEKLPRTLVHGDCKVANFAILPDRRVAAIDWAVVGAAPISVDLGWHIAVNATRLSRSKVGTMERYRELLSRRLPKALDDDVWEALVRLSVVLGARTLLWSKALAGDAGRPGAEKEWDWWCEALEQACA